MLSCGRRIKEKLLAQDCPYLQNRQAHAVRNSHFTAIVDPFILPVIPERPKNLTRSGCVLACVGIDL